MKTKTYEEIVERVQVIEQFGGESTLNQRLELVQNRWYEGDDN